MRNISTPHCRHLSSAWQAEAQRGIVNIWKVRENVEIFQRITSLQFWWVLHHTKTIDNRSKMEKFFKNPIKLRIHLKSLKGVGSKVNPFNPLSASVLSVTRAPRDTRHVTRDTCTACAGGGLCYQWHGVASRGASLQSRPHPSSASSSHLAAWFSITRAVNDIFSSSSFHNLYYKIKVPSSQLLPISHFRIYWDTIVNKQLNI